MKRSYCFFKFHSFVKQPLLFPAFLVMACSFRCPEFRKKNTECTTSNFPTEVAKSKNSKLVELQGVDYLIPGPPVDVLVHGDDEICCWSSASEIV